MASDATIEKNHRFKHLAKTLARDKEIIGLSRMEWKKKQIKQQENIITGTTVALLSVL